MKQPPAVSVLMPAFNAGRFLKIAVQSILNQTFTNFELIIIDDGSTDESFKSMASIQDDRVKILRNRSISGSSHPEGVGTGICHCALDRLFGCGRCRASVAIGIASRCVQRRSGTGAFG